MAVLADSVWLTLVTALARVLTFSSLLLGWVENDFQSFLMHRENHPLSWMEPSMSHNLAALYGTI